MTLSKGTVPIYTNLRVYLYADESDKEKTEKIESLVDKYFEDITVSTQVLGEFFHVLTRKGLQEKEKARLIAFDLIANFTVLEVLQSSVKKAMDISMRYGYSYWDNRRKADNKESI